MRSSNCIFLVNAGLLNRMYHMYASFCLLSVNGLHKGVVMTLLHFFLDGTCFRDMILLCISYSKFCFAVLCQFFNSHRVSDHAMLISLFLITRCLFRSGVQADDWKNPNGI